MEDRGTSPTRWITFPVLGDAVEPGPEPLRPTLEPIPQPPMGSPAVDMHPTTQTRAATAGVALAVAVLAGCSSTQHPAPSASAPSASAPPASVASPSQPTTAASASSPSSSAKCLSGTFAVVVPTTDNPVRSACLHMGTAVDIELLALRGVTWTAPVASDASVATVTDQVTPIGTRHDQVKLLRPGTVTFTSTSGSSADPSGPPSRVWTLTLTVVP